MDTAKILNDDAIAEHLQSLDKAWTAIGNDYLVCVFRTEDFNEGVAVINKIAAIADKAQHHPDIALSFGRVEVKINTHSVAGITETDFALAAAIDRALR